MVDATHLPQAELAKVLGPFDATRMLRLEGLPAQVAGPLTRAFVECQTMYPAVDRNLRYVTSSVGLQAGSLDRRSDGKPGDLLLAVCRNVTYDGIVIPRTVFSLENLGYPEGLRRVARTRLTDGRLTIQPQSLEQLFAYAAWHEHAHALHIELREFDRLTGSHLELRLVEAVQRAIPNYLPVTHDHFREALGAQGLGAQGRRNFTELVAECFAGRAHGVRSPLIDSVGEFFDEHLSYGAPTRSARQHQIVERSSHDFLSLGRGNGAFANTLDTDDLRSLMRALDRGGESDRRFARCAVQAWREGEAIGTVMPALMLDRFDRGQREGIAPSIEALRASESMGRRMQAKAERSSPLSL